jgi:hypothetical protein
MHLCRMHIYIFIGKWLNIALLRLAHCGQYFWIQLQQESHPLLIQERCV